jgi:ribonuclease HII
VNLLFEFDLSQHHLPLIGVDEAGRGPLAGPVVAAAVQLNYPSNFSYLADSKLLKAPEREIAFDEIIANSAAYHIVDISAEEIDQINILNATKKAMKLCVEKLNLLSALVLIDGNQRIDILHKQQTVVKGDSKSAAIAAASILAKVHRDRQMLDYHKKYPEYGFDQHKGYATKFHREQIKKHGACPIHRLSFLGNIQAEMNQMSLF